MELQLFNHTWQEPFGYLKLIAWEDVSHVHIIDQEKAMLKFKTGLFYHISTEDGHNAAKWIDQQKNRNMMEVQ